MLAMEACPGSLCRRRRLTNHIVEKTFACMKEAYDRGINFFDCAEAYAGGESEIVMGQAIKKFGYVGALFSGLSICYGDL